MPAINNVYDFNVEVSQGFQATLTPLDDNKNPIDLTGFSASMLLTDAQQQVAFEWSTQTGQITIADNQIFINIPGDGTLTPVNPDLANETYPSKTYRYNLNVLDPQNNNYLTWTGNFTIYVTI